MRKIALLLTVAIVLGLVLSFASCGKTEGTRYTITKEEFEAIETQNVTVKMETYQVFDGETDHSTVIIKESNGISCYCDNIIEDDDTSHSHTDGNTTVISKQSSIKSSGIDENVDVQDSGSSKMTRSGWSIGSVYTFESDDIVDLPPGAYVSDSTVTFNPELSVVSRFPSYTVTTMHFASSWITSAPTVDFPYIDGSVSDGSYDWISQIQYIGSYKDSENKIYKYNDFIVSSTVGDCTKYYNDKVYVEITVDDENDESCVKWTEAIGISRSDVEFEDLTFNEQEKAYEYYRDDKENNMKVKAYLYFEDGLLVKQIMFQSISHNGDDEPYDVSKLTPNDSYISENYYTTVDEYYDHGKTKIEGHSFSPDDIITKIED